MQDLKLSRNKLNENMRNYEKMQYHAVSAEEQDAVNNAITAVQGLMNARKPSQRLDAAADSANTQLMQAAKDRRKREAKGAKLFASKGFIPVVDQHDETHLGPFTNMYLENLRMKRLENDAKGLREEAKGMRVPKKVKRDITPQSAVRRKEQNADNRWLAHDRDTSLNAKKSQAYHKEQKKMQVKSNLVQMLHDAAQSYKIAKFSNPNLKYEATVAGTVLQGITNFEAMTPQQKRDEASRVAAQSMQMAQKENKLENDVEDYHRKYSEGSSILPYKEWEKTWTMDRQANMQVNPKEEMAIRAMVAKMKAAHEKNDIMADMRLVSKTHNEREQMHDNEVAQEVAEAPTKATLEKLTAQNILGAKQLAKDTAFANEKLANETVNPHIYGPKKALDPQASPNYRVTKEMAKAKVAHKAIRQQRARLLKDARNLAASGSRADRAILDADEKLVRKSKPTMTAGDRHSVRVEQKHWQKMRKRLGKKGVEAEKAGVEARFKRGEKAWNQVKQNVLTSGAAMGLASGKSALDSLPTSSKDPALEQPSKFNLNGNTARSALPVRKNSATNSGLSRMPQLPANDMAVNDAEEEPKPAKGYYAKEDKALVNGKTEAQVAKAQVDKEVAKAKKEAAGVEGSGIGAKLAGASDSEKDIANTLDGTKIQKSVSKVEVPKAKVEKDEKGMPWDSTFAAKAINDAQKGKSHATKVQPGRSTYDGVPQ